MVLNFTVFFSRDLSLTLTVLMKKEDEREKYLHDEEKWEKLPSQAPTHLVVINVSVRSFSIRSYSLDRMFTLMIYKKEHLFRFLEASSIIFYSTFTFHAYFVTIVENTREKNGISSNDKVSNILLPHKTTDSVLFFVFFFIFILFYTVSEWERTEWDL